MRSWWPWVLMLVLVVGTWFGWRHSQLLRYQASAHQRFVDDFQNGIRGAYSATESARRWLTEGETSLAAQELTDSHHYLRLMLSGATGMSIRLGPTLLPLEVTSRYLNEASQLRDQLLNSSNDHDLSQRLDNLSHDLALLLELLGSDQQREWLTGATADEFRARYQSWREQARIKPGVP